MNLTPEMLAKYTNKCADSPPFFIENFLGLRLSPAQKELVESIDKYDTTVGLFARQCLVGDTRITMADGSSKLLRRIVKGEKILSYNEETRQFEPDVVVNAWQTEPKDVYSVKTWADSTIRCSDMHQFLTGGDGWKSLRDGLGKSDGSRTVAMRRCRKFVLEMLAEPGTPIGREEMYDLEVEKNHNFIANGFIVHNSGKSTALGAYIVWRLLFGKGFEVNGYHHNEDILVAAPAEEQTKIIFQKVKQHIMRNEMIRNFVDGDMTISSIKMKNGARLGIVSASVNANIRGRSPSLLISDESQSVDDVVLNSVLMPMTTTTKAHKVFIGCVTEGTRILDSGGMERIGTCPTGYTPTEKSLYGLGGFHKATHRYSNERVLPTVRVTTNIGNSLEATENHRLWNGEKWVRMDEIKVGDTLVIQRGQNVFGSFDYNGVYSHKFIKNERISLTEDMCYMLGAYLGDGCADNHSVIITNIDIEVKSFLRSFGFHEKGDGIHFKLNNTNTVRFMRELGFERVRAPKKIIPEFVFRLPEVKQREILSGLFDTDGSSNKSGVVLSSTSHELVKQVQMMLLNYGIVSAIYRQVTKPSKKVKVSSVVYTLSMNGFNARIFYERIGFRIKRKQANYRNVKGIGFYKEAVVPFDYDEIKRDTKLRYGWHDMKTHRHITLDRLRKFRDLYGYLPEKYSDWVDQKYYFATVREVQKSEAMTYDFVIPETHSYFTNGFISHNTPLKKNWFYKVTNNPRSHVIRQPYNLCPFVDASEIERLRSDKGGTIPVQLWQQEYEVMFLEAAASPFPSDLVYPNLEVYEYSSGDCGPPGSKKTFKLAEPKAEYVVGIDLGRERDSTVMHVLRKDVLPYRLVHTEAWLHRPYTFIAGRLRMISDYYSPSAVNVDQTNEKGFQDLVNEAGIAINPIPFTMKEKEAMVRNLQVLFEKGLVKLPKEHELLYSQITSQQFETNRYGNRLYYHPTDEHDDELWAFALSAMALNVDVTGYSPITGFGGHQFSEAMPALVAVGRKDLSKMTNRERDLELLRTIEKETHGNRSFDDPDSESMVTNSGWNGREINERSNRPATRKWKDYGG